MLATTKQAVGAGLLAVLCSASHPYGGTEPFSPELPRKVAGLITQVEGEQMTISPTLNNNTKHMTGRLDGKKTRVTINGRAAHAQDLKITFLARGEMGLDDVWVSVSAERK